MALAEAAVRDRGLHAGRQVEEAESVRDRRSCATDAVRDFLLAEPELLDQLAVRLRGLERIEILALEVLDEGDLELLAVGELADDRRDAFETGRLGGTQPPLAGDELVAVDRLHDEDRLEDAVLGDAGREGGKLLGIEPLAGLERVRADPRRSGSRPQRSGRDALRDRARQDRDRDPAGARA